MTTPITPGAVVFCHDHRAMARFYSGLTAMTVRDGDDTHTLVASDNFELVLHAMRGEPAPAGTPVTREDACIKLAFPVDSLAAARERCAALGARLRPSNEEWQGRGFRACDGVDPEGNVFQVREALA